MYVSSTVAQDMLHCGFSTLRHPAISIFKHFATYYLQYVLVSISFILSAASLAKSQEWTLNRSIPELRLVR